MDEAKHLQQMTHESPEFREFMQKYDKEHYESITKPPFWGKIFKALKDALRK